MRIKQVASNMTELHKDDGTVVMFSYETPVAAIIPGKGFIHTSTKYSKTTSRHINNWVSENSKVIAQEELNKLV